MEQSILRAPNEAEIADDIGRNCRGKLTLEKSNRPHVRVNGEEPSASSTTDSLRDRFNAEFAMKHSRVISLAATLCAMAMMAGRASPAMESIDIDLTQWTPPDIATVGDDPFGKLVKHGYALFTDTANEVGPTVSDLTNDLPATILLAKTAICGAGASHMPCR